MFVGCQGLHGDDPIGVGGISAKSLEIESRRFGLVVKDPRSPKGVDFIGVTGLGFWNKTDGREPSSLVCVPVGRLRVSSSGWEGRRASRRCASRR